MLGFSARAKYPVRIIAADQVDRKRNHALFRDHAKRLDSTNRPAQALPCHSGDFHQAAQQRCIDGAEFAG